MDEFQPDQPHAPVYYGSSARNCQVQPVVNPTTGGRRRRDGKEKPPKNRARLVTVHSSAPLGPEAHARKSPME